MNPADDVRGWLAARGLGDAELLGLIPNNDYDRLSLWQRRLLGDRLLGDRLELHAEGNADGPV